MNEYCAGVAESEKLAIAITYLSSSAHEWYIGTKILENCPLQLQMILFRHIKKIQPHRQDPYCKRQTGQMA